MIPAAYVSHLIPLIPAKYAEMIEEVIEFIDAADVKHRAFPESDPEGVRFLLSYHLLKNTILVSRNGRGMIDGLALWHRFKSPWAWGQIDRWREDDKDGKDIVVSHFVSTSPEARKKLFTGMRGRITDEDISIAALRKNKVVNFSMRDAERFSKLKFN